MPGSQWQVAPAGDRALLVTLGRVIDPELLGQVLALDQALADRRPRGLVSTVPAYASLLCHYDPDITDPVGPGIGSSVKIAPGDKRVGYISFEVPDGTKLTQFQFTLDSGFGPDTGQWEL